MQNQFLFKNDLKVVHVDISAEDISQNVRSTVGLCGDVKSIMCQMNEELDRQAKHNQQDEIWRLY